MRAFQAWQSGNGETPACGDLSGDLGWAHLHWLEARESWQGKHPADAITRKPSTTTILTVHGRSCRSLLWSNCKRHQPPWYGDAFPEIEAERALDIMVEESLDAIPTLWTSFVMIYFLPLVFATFPPQACRRPTLFTILPQWAASDSRRFPSAAFILTWGFT